MKNSKVGIGAASALLLTCSGWSTEVVAHAAQKSRKFDIVCYVNGRTVGAYNPEFIGYAGYNMPQSWAYRFRYAINLNRGEFVDFADSKPIVKKFVSSSASTIYFENSRDHVVSFQMRTRTYRSKARLSAYRDGFAMGRCRFAPFTGGAARR